MSRAVGDPDLIDPHVRREFAGRSASASTASSASTATALRTTRLLRLGSEAHTITDALTWRSKPQLRCHHRSLRLHTVIEKRTASNDRLPGGYNRQGSGTLGIGGAFTKGVSPFHEFSRRGLTRRNTLTQTEPLHTVSVLGWPHDEANRSSLLQRMQYSAGPRQHRRFVQRLHPAAA